MDNSIFKEKLKYIVILWDKTEIIVKLSENVCGAILSTSINELRYAARNLIESILILQSESSNNLLIDKIEKNLLNAQHDSVDAIIAYIDNFLDNLLNYFDIELTHKYLPNYSENKALIQKLSFIVNESRQERGNSKNVYDDMVEKDIPKLIEFWKQAIISEKLMKAAALRRQELLDKQAKDAEIVKESLVIAKKSLEEAKKSRVWTIVGVAIAVLTLTEIYPFVKNIVILKISGG